MENRKLGILLIVIGLVVGGMFLYYTQVLINQSAQAGCYQETSCSGMQSSISFNNIAVGIFSFIFALGFYLIFFNKTDAKILKKLEDEKQSAIEDMKFQFLLKALDEYEKKVVLAVRQQDGITQNTLRLRTDMSKAKLSYVLQELERRGIVKREKKGKTLSIYLKI